jgi:hypothetical protein
MKINTVLLLFAEKKMNVLNVSRLPNGAYTCMLSGLSDEARYCMEQITSSLTYYNGSEDREEISSNVRKLRELYFTVFINGEEWYF